VTSHKLIYAPFLPIAALLLCCPACNRPEWVEKTDRRREAIHRHASSYAEFDAAGTERMGLTVDRIRRNDGYRAEHLENTATLVKTEFESDVDRWREEQPKRRDFVSRYWHGQPETIPSTWSRMIY
jgi:hypothetical protein